MPDALCLTAQSSERIRSAEPISSKRPLAIRRHLLYCLTNVRQTIVRQWTVIPVRLQGPRPAAAIGRRDLAMLSLLAWMGLRGEVAGLASMTSTGAMED